MQDPLLIPLSERTEKLRESYKKIPLERLPQDVVKLFDRLAIGERERNRLEAKVQSLERRLNSANTKIWILTAVCSAEFAIVVFLANALLQRLH